MRGRHDAPYIVMPCEQCGEQFVARFDAASGTWKPAGVSEDDEQCHCARKVFAAWDLDDPDTSYERVSAVARRQSEQVAAYLADVARISFARSVPAGQLALGV